MGWERQVEASLSPPASEAGRQDGSNSAPSESAQSGLAAAGSEEKKTCVIGLFLFFPPYMYVNN